MKYIFTLCLSLCVSSFAQTADSILPVKPFNYMFNSTFNALSGTQKNLSTANNLDLGLQFNKLNINLANTYLFGKANSIKSFDDLASNVLIEILPKKAIYPLLRMNFLKSFSLKKDFEMSYIPGIGFNPQKLKLPALLMMGLGYEKLNYQLPTLGGIRNFSLMRLNLGLNGKQIKLKKLGNIDYAMGYMPALKDFSNYRFNSNIQYALPLMKRLSLVSNFIYNHENLVPVGIRPDQFITTFGLGVQN